VLEPYPQPRSFENRGHWGVMGKRLIQSASDIFLELFHCRLGKHCCVRQLELDLLLCPRQGGDAAASSSHQGDGDDFDRGIESLAVAYADQMEADHAALAAAMKAGRVEALNEEDL
jgi:hypothetical protein